jgi:thymidylate synthase ThyX
MPVSAKIIADSISDVNSFETRLTTMEVTMHRFVLAEFNTHRKFSRNSASSRAIPIEKRIKQVVEDPAMPLQWGSNRPGMQAGAELDDTIQISCVAEWLTARDEAVTAADRLSRLGLHKQVANRLLEPFLWHTAIVSSTEWDNFFKQRDSPLAQPEIKELAVHMKEALAGSEPVVRSPYADRNGWHLPYVSDDEREAWWVLDESYAKKVSVARCARVSYLTQDGIRDSSKDVEMYNRLYEADPPHMSPFEHVAISEPRIGFGSAAYWTGATMRRQCGNFDHWLQLRGLVFAK